MSLLQVQVHIKMPTPGPGIEYSGELLDALAERWLKRQSLPRGVSVSMIEWRSKKSGAWRGETDPARMNRVRYDFRFIAYEGFTFTGTRAAVSPLG